MPVASVQQTRPKKKDVALLDGASQTAGPVPAGVVSAAGGSPHSGGGGDGENGNTAGVDGGENVLLMLLGSDTNGSKLPDPISPKSPSTSMDMSLVLPALALPWCSTSRGCIRNYSRSPN